MNNPLLENHTLPAFDRIQPEHVIPAIDQLLEENRETVEQLVSITSGFSWDNFVQPLEDMDDRLNRAWSPVSHLHSVRDNEALRKAYSECIGKLSDYATEMGQHEGLYKGFKAVAESDEYARLVPAQKKIIDNALRDFRLSGIELNGEDRATYRRLQQELTKLQTRFEENLLDATQAWKKHVIDQDMLSGLPQSVLGYLEQSARQNGFDEGWLLTLDFPCYLPVMQYADDAGLRRELYTAYNTRASAEAGNDPQWDNSAVMVDILNKRQEIARLLGFASYADLSLAKKMATTPRQVLDFLTELADKSGPVAQTDLEQVNRYAREKYNIDTLDAWDIAYYSEKLKQAAFRFTDEDLRPYFSVPNVLKGLFGVVQRLYELDIRPREGVTIWHDDVMFYDIYNGSGELQGSFYLDLYARQHKRGGAWMDECVVRRKLASGIQTPVAYLTCNFTPPVGGKPALITHDEVITLFHEFGHGLHHMLTRVDYAGVSGINGVPWDAVELPSQFMENWCWEREALDLFARHHESGKKIPADLFEKMWAAKNFQSGMQMVRQLEFSLFDFRLHMQAHIDSADDIQQLLDEVREQVAVIRPPVFNRFQNSFSHIFAGGYAAGYYSYKWAEVLSADAFSRFEEQGIFNSETGKAFLHSILEQGGSREPLELFIEFRGREPSVEPLLRHSGITA